MPHSCEPQLSLPSGVSTEDYGYDGGTVGFTSHLPFRQIAKHPYAFDVWIYRFITDQLVSWSFCGNIFAPRRKRAVRGELLERERARSPTTEVKLSNATPDTGDRSGQTCGHRI